MVKSAGVLEATPVPVRVDDCVPTASTTERVAADAPAALGLKAIVMTQLDPAPSEVEQPLDTSGNEVGFAPPMLIEVIESAALPALISVKVCVALVAPTLTLPKFAVAGVRAACGAGADVPVPVSEDVCVPTASTTVREAAYAPAALGLKLTFTAQPELAASELEHPFEVIVKAVGFAPLSAIDEMESGALPALVSVKVCAVLMLPAATLPKFAVAGVREACGAGAGVPVPVSADVCVPTESITLKVPV